VIDLVSDHPDWVPDGLTLGDVIQLRFDNTVVTTWLNHGAEPDAEKIPGGQISELSSDSEVTSMVTLLANTIYCTTTSASLEKPS